MAGSLNKVLIIGNLGRDPEIRTMQNGDPVANLSVAASESWKDKHTGEKRERTEWVRVVIFGKLADVAQKYLHKGSKVYVEGQLQTRKWTDQSGQEKYTTEVVLSGFAAKLIMLDGKNAGGTPRDDGGADPDGYSGGRTAPSAGAPDFDDEIPF